MQNVFNRPNITRHPPIVKITWLTLLSLWKIFVEWTRCRERPSTIIKFMENSLGGRLSATDPSWRGASASSQDPSALLINSRSLILTTVVLLNLSCLVTYIYMCIVSLKKLRSFAMTEILTNLQTSFTVPNSMKFLKDLM